MSDHQKELDVFSNSMSSYATYPDNLLRSCDFPYVLESYSLRMQNSDNYVFQRNKETLQLRDLHQLDNGGYRYDQEEIIGTEKLTEVLSLAKPDPCRRFCFLQSASSRDPLMCSHAQLAMVFSRHQVMAKFLDFVFTFRRREEPHSYTSFRCEDDLNPLDGLVKAKHLGKSGVRIQHCFNVLGFESVGKSPTQWWQRQVAACHSFDLLNGNVFWTIIKGNNTIQKRMEGASAKSLVSRPNFPSSILHSLQQALHEHLLLLQWGTENWDPYIDSLEKTFRTNTEITRYPDIQDLVEDIQTRRMLRRRTTMDAHLSPTTSRPGVVRTVRDYFRQTKDPAVGQSLQLGLSFTSKNTGLSSQTKSPHEMLPLKNENLLLDTLASFPDLQNLSAISKKLQTAITVIDQNKRVYTDVRDRYIELRNSELFIDHFQEGETRTQCRQAIDDFVRQIRDLTGDLESFQGRLRTVLHNAEQAGEVYNHIFQMRNTRTAEFFAISGQDSADLMQIWTEQMHQKTLSMHLITFFTLIFLPGTFVATWFSSGIIIFGAEGSSGFGSEMGDWKVRIAGLKLFCAVCIPLLTITLGVWLFAYASARTKSTLGRLPERSTLQGLKKQVGLDHMDNGLYVA